MIEGLAGLCVLAAGALLLGVGTVTNDEQARLDGPFPIVELRQYALHEGQRDVLIDLFEREFVESQEAVGMKVIGTFIDLDRPDHFVWIRGYKDMDARLSGLTDFYGGPVWQAHRQAANATMIDSDNVLLLHAAEGLGTFEFPSSRPQIGEQWPAGLIATTIYHLKVPAPEAMPLFGKQVVPRLESAGVRPLASFLTEASPNNFPRLPVREGEQVLIWFAAFADEADWQTHQAAIDEAAKTMAPLLAKAPETLRLRPTARSLIRGPVQAGGLHDFDFLHGKWAVKHRRLKSRGTGSKEWNEFAGTAETRPLLGGLCNVEEHRIDGQPFSGVALRCFDRAAKRWAIYWVSDRDGQLQPPVHGSFDQGIGRFEGDDRDGDRPIRVRFLWQRTTADSARWEQAFSYDAGTSWETNWIMEFQRTGQ